MSNKYFSEFKKIWNWVWNSDSFSSWLVALLLIFVFVKFVFFPFISLLMGTTLPIAGVESSSMDHQIVKNEYNELNLCGKQYTSKQRNYINFDEYWENCGDWYENIEISKEQFSKFTLKNGFRKGDIIIVWGRFETKIGDVIIFKGNTESTAKRPIIHRVVKINVINEEKIIETKGDHNSQQLTLSNNVYATDETRIKEEQIIGKAIIKIPLLGWPKIWLVDITKWLLSY